MYAVYVSNHKIATLHVLTDSEARELYHSLRQTHTHAVWELVRIEEQGEITLSQD